MQVIGAGFGRTGTMSLKVALEELGFGPCYHMFEVDKNPDHVAFWQAAGEGQSVDWRALFSNYQAGVDWPVCAFYEQLMEVYPEAKVLLSVRDPEQWYESARTTIYRVSGPHAAPPVEHDRHAFHRMVNTIVWQGSLSGRFEEKAEAIAIFERHIQHVKDRVPGDKLLVYDVREGWEPLCQFLGVPIPDTPFPKVNEAATFLQQAAEGRQSTDSV